MKANEDGPPVVVDFGTSLIKAGLAGESTPSIVFPPIVGKGKGKRDRCFFGESAIYCRGEVDLSYPIFQGTIADWDDVERIWSHLFYNEFRIPPEDRSLLFTEPEHCTEAQRERFFEIFFERLDLPAACVILPSVATIYSPGIASTTGLVLECGDSVSHIVPIYEGFAIRNSIVRFDVSGGDLTTYLGELMNHRGYQFKNTYYDRYILRKMKENVCFVSKNFQVDLDTMIAPVGDRTYEASEVMTVNIGNEMFRCAEALFNPEMVDGKKKRISIAEAANEAIMRCSPDLRGALYSNVVMTGATMFEGFAERMKSELLKIAPSDVKIVVSKPSEGVKYPAWTGASMFASLSTFQDACLSREEYYERGRSIVHRKFL